MQFSNADEVEEFLKTTNWQSFEQLVGHIFEQHGFDSKVNTVKVFENTKRQYDVIAERYGKTYAIECKKWKKSCYSKIVDAVEKHEERSRRINASPIIVTLINEDVRKEGNTFIVPIFELNDFLRNV